MVVSDKYVAVVSKTQKPIMISGHEENPVLEALKAQEGVEVISGEEFAKRISESNLSQEEMADLEESIDTLILLDEMDEIQLDEIAKEIQSRKLQQAEWEEEMKKKVQDAMAKGYSIANGHGTLKRLTEKIGRNDQCPCGSGKKYKKCHLNK